MEVLHLFVFLAVGVVLADYSFFTRETECWELLQKNMKDCEKRAYDALNNVDKNAKKRNKDWNTQLTRNLTNDMKKITKKFKEEMKKAKQLENNAAGIGACVTTYQTIHLQGFADSFENVIKCLNNATNTVLEGTKKANETFNRKSYVGPERTDTSRRRWQQCPKPPQHKCLEEKVVDLAEKVKTTVNETNTAIDTGKKLESIFMNTTETCLKNYNKNVTDMNKKHKENIDSCTIPKN